jgi:hypothetical protein
LFLMILWNQNVLLSMFADFPRLIPHTWRNKKFHFTVLFQTATFEMQRNLFSAYHFPVLFKKKSFSSQSIFYKFYYFPKFLFSAQNVFLLSILQHARASQSNHINTMLANEMVLAPLQKLKIKYELSYQSTTRLKYIDNFDTHQWTSTVDNTVRSLIHFTIFIWYYVVKHFPSFIKKNIIIK